MEIYIKGNSGCSLKIINSTVFKSSAPNYLPRLQKQCNKQKEFYKLYCNNANLIIPKVLFENFSNGGGGFAF